MNQDASSQGSHPVPSLSWPSCATATVNDVLEFVNKAPENDRLDLIQELLDKLGPETAGDANAEKRLALQSLGSFFLAQKEMRSQNFPLALEKSKEAAEGVKQIDQNERRDLALGIGSVIQALQAVRSINVGVALDQLLQAEEHFLRAGKYAQTYQNQIDAVRSEALVAQGIKALLDQDFDTAETFFERAAQAVEAIAAKYYEEGSKGYFYHRGLAHHYKSVFNHSRISREFSQFGFASLAAEESLNLDALEAKKLWANVVGDKLPILKQFSFHNEGLIALSDLYQQLSRIMQRVLNYTFKADNSTFSLLQQQVKKAHAAFVQIGSVGLPYVRECDRLSNLVNKLEHSTPIASRSVVVLVHGIRTFANWELTVREELEKESGLRVELTNYEYFDVIRFLLPFVFFRRRATNRVLNQLRTVIARNRGANISVLAHSFGTYIVAEILKSQPDVTIDRLVFCGSIVPAEDDQFSEAIRLKVGNFVNEVGSKDIWPALAESATTGYGRTGTYGFRRPGMRDRWHKGYAHSDFLTANFCRQY